MQSNRCEMTQCKTQYHDMKKTVHFSHKGTNLTYMKAKCGLLTIQQFSFYLMIDNIVITVIYTSAVGSSADGICHILDVRNFCYDLHRKTKPALHSNTSNHIITRSTQSAQTSPRCLFYFILLHCTTQAHHKHR